MAEEVAEGVNAHIKRQKLGGWRDEMRERCERGTATESRNELEKVRQRKVSSVRVRLET